MAKRTATLLLLSLLLLLAMGFSAGLGAVSISPAQLASIILSWLDMAPPVAFEPQQEAVFRAIRLPRVVLGALVGASLAMAGGTLQGLYRNPLADPGLLGISGGASVLAAASIVMEIRWFGIYSLPLFAFMGSLASITIIYGLSRRHGKMQMQTLLLAGIAINALCMALTGFFSSISTDDQLRSITFWQLGSLGGASWPSILAALPLLAVALCLIPAFAGALNAMMLGESNARYLGIHVEKVKIALIVLIALGVGSSVAVSGMIGFVGLVVPHMIRLLVGPDNRLLLPASALLGATLLVLADLFARTSVSPSELPIGVVTAFLGAPFLLYLILRPQQRNG